MNGSKSGLHGLADRSLASQASPKDTILVSFWTPELESSGPEDQEPGTGTGAQDLTRRGPVARRIFTSQDECYQGYNNNGYPLGGHRFARGLLQVKTENINFVK